MGERKEVVPWKFVLVKDGNGKKPVATGWMIETYDEQEVFEMVGGTREQAMLVAAAPKLLAALEEMDRMYVCAWDRVEGGLLMMEGSTARFDEACRVAREVLTEATGVNRILVDDDGNPEAAHVPPQGRDGQDDTLKGIDP